MIPPLEEQKQIAHILSTVDRKIEDEQKRKQVSKALHKLMSGEIRLRDENMKKEEILKKIRENRDKIRSFGVRRIGIFGSFVRGEEKEGSDIDIIVEFEEGKKNFDTS